MCDHPEDIASLARKLGLAWPIAIPDIPPQNPITGFFRSDCRVGLREIAAQVSPARALEIGAWFGESTVFLSSLFNEVVTIDHWEGNDEDCCRQKMAQCPHPLYQQFLANIQHCGNVLPLKCDHRFAKYLPLGTSLGLWPFLALPVLEKALGFQPDEAGIERLIEHTVRLFKAGTSTGATP